MSVTPRTVRTAHGDELHEAAYQVYASLETPSVKETATLMGISPRTVELWCAKEGWVQRRAEETLDRVAAIRRTIELKLLTNAEQLTDRLVHLALQDDDLPVSARATIHALGLLGYTPVSKSASVVQHLSGSDASATSGTDQRSVLDIAAALNDRLAALGGASHPPSPPEEINETNERTMTGGVPQSRASDTSHLPQSGALPTSDSSSSSSSSPDGDERDDGVIDAEWSDGAVPEEE